MQVTATQHDASANGTPIPAKTTRLWHSMAHMPSVKHAECVIVSGEGSHIWTQDGRRLLDAPASLWYCNVGHGRKEIAQAVARQFGQIEAYSSFQQYTTRPAIELAERVAALSPLEDPRVFLTSGGSDSVEVAAKLARRFWAASGRPDKRTIVTREYGYHGLHAFGTSIGGIEANRDGYGTLVHETARVPMHDAAALEALILERGPDTIAAFFCEPVIGTGGVHLPKDDYLDEVQRICRRHDVLLVIDEVITGFGRTGEMFASQRYGLTPDVMLCAKGISSGYLPLGAVVVGARVAEPFWADDSELTFRHGLTYSGHSTACAAALSNIDILEREELPSRVRSLETTLETTLRAFASHPLVKEVRAGVGLLGAIEFHDPEAGTQVAAECCERGVLGRQLNDGALHVSPPFIITEDEIAALGRAVDGALDAVASTGVTA